MRTAVRLRTVGVRTYAYGASVSISHTTRRVFFHMEEKME